MRDSKEYTIHSAVTPVTVTSSTDATPIVVTATSHGLATGDLVFIYGHTTNVAANGISRVTRVDANSFSLQDHYTGANKAGSGAGAGSGGDLSPAPKIALVEDFRNAVFSVHTSGTSTLTLSLVGSVGKTDGSTPNFGATQSASNPWSFIQAVNLNSGAAIDGTTGIALSGADINLAYEANINGLKYLTVIPTAWTQGTFTVKMKVFSNV